MSTEEEEYGQDIKDSYKKPVIVDDGKKQNSKQLVLTLPSLPRLSSGVLTSRYVVIMSLLVFVLSMVALYRPDLVPDDPSTVPISLVIACVSGVLLLFAIVNGVIKATKFAKNYSAKRAEESEKARKEALYLRYFNATKGVATSLTREEFLARDESTFEHLVKAAEAESALRNKSAKTSPIMTALGLDSLPFMSTQTAEKTSKFAGGLGLLWKGGAGIFAIIWYVLSYGIALLAYFLVPILIILGIIIFAISFFADKLRRFVLFVSKGYIDIGDFDALVKTTLKDLGLSFFDWILDLLGLSQVAEDWRRKQEEQVEREKEEQRRKAEERRKMVQEEERKREEEELRRAKEEFYSGTRFCRYVIGAWIVISFLYGLIGGEIYNKFFGENLNALMFVFALFLLPTITCYESYDDVSFCWMIGLMALACTLFYRMGMSGVKDEYQTPIYILQMMAIGFVYYISCYREPLYDLPLYKSEFGMMSLTSRLLIGIPLVLLILGPFSWFVSLLIHYAPLFFLAMAFLVMALATFSDNSGVTGGRMTMAFFVVVLVAMARVTSYDRVDAKDSAEAATSSSFLKKQETTASDENQLIFVVVAAILSIVTSVMVSMMQNQRIDTRLEEENRQMEEEEEKRLAAMWWWQRNFWSGKTVWEQKEDEMYEDE